jgi:hypothetical protein
MKNIEAIIITVALSLVGFLFFGILCEYFINKLSDKNPIKNWWRNNIIGIDNEN